MLNDCFVGDVRKSVPFDSPVVDVVEDHYDVDVAVSFRVCARAATEKDKLDEMWSVQVTNACLEGTQGRSDAWRHSDLPSI